MRDFLTLWSYRIIIFVFAAAVVYVVYLIFPRSMLRFDQLDPRLPELFHLADKAWVFWTWVAVLLAAAVWGGFQTVGVYRDHRWGLTADSRPNDSPERTNGASAETLAFPSGSRSGDSVFLLLAAGETLVQDLLRSAGIEPTAKAVVITQPKRAVFVNATSYSSIASADATSRLEQLCRDLYNRDQELPSLRGVLVVLPIDGAWRDDPVAIGHRIHADLQIIRDVLQVETPVYLRLTAEGVAAASLIRYAGLRGEGAQGTLGVSFQREEHDADEKGVVLRRLNGCRFRVRRRILELIARTPLDTDRNRRLMALDTWLATIIPSITALTVVAFPPADPERPFLRAIDLVATGAEPSQRAYAFSSVYVPVLEAEELTRWTAKAIADDQRYRRKAAKVGFAGGALALAVWSYVQFGLDSLGVPGWGLFAILAISWIVIPIRLLRRWPAPRL